MITFKDIRDCSLLSTDNWHAPQSLTLTLRQARTTDNGSLVWLDEHQCKKALAVFLHHLYRAVYGNTARRFNNRVRVIPVLERSDSGRWHVHGAIELPRHLNAIQFYRLIRACWSKVDWAYRRTHTNKRADQGWVRYMLKPAQKSVFENWSDCIVWEWLHNPPIVDA
jgi:hypothetical protein